MRNPRPPLSLLLLAAALPLWALAPAPARGGEKLSHLEELENMTPEAKEKFLAKKVKEVDGMFQTQVGRYVVYSALGAESAYYWGAVLDEFTDEARDEGVVPKEVKNKKLARNPPTVYIMKDQASYNRMLNEFGVTPPGWSTGLFAVNPKTKGPLLIAWKFSEDEAEMRTAILYEATHQLVYYHISHTDVPTWFDEGFATNLETYDTSRRLKANLYYCVFVNKHANALAVLKPADVVPFSKLINISNEQWGRASKDQVRANFFSAWLTVNFFFTTKDGRKTVTKLINSYAGAGKSPSLPVAAIDAQIKEHLDKTVTPCLKYGRLVFFLLENRLDDARRAINIAGGMCDKKSEEFNEMGRWFGELQRCGDDMKERAALADKVQKKMLAEFPDNPEAQFYGAWLDLVRDGGDAAKAGQVAETVTKLLKANPDFYHPAHNYVLAEAYFRAKQPTKAKEFLAKAIRDNRKHPATLELKKAIKEAGN